MPPARHPTLSFGQKKRPPTEPTAVPRSEPKGIFAERFLNGLARGGLLSLSLYITVEDWGMSPNLNPLIPLIPLLLGNRTGLVESTGLGKKVVPMFGELCSCCCLPLLPGFACSIHTTWGPPFRRALYLHAPSRNQFQKQSRSNI